MTPSRFRFTLGELLLLTALCGLVMGMVTASRREAGRWYVQGLYFSPDGRFLVADYLGERVRLWNVQSSNPRTVELGLKNERPAHLRVLGFADSDTLVGQRADFAAGRVTSQLVLWNVLEDRLERTQALGFSQAGTVWLCSTGESVIVVNPLLSGALDVWELPHGRKRGAIAAATAGTWTYCPCASGNTLALYTGLTSSGQGNSKVELCDLQTLQRVKSWLLDDYCFKLAMSRDGRWLAAHTHHGILIWDLFAPSQGPQRIHCESMGGNLQFTPDARSLLVGRHDGSFEIWDVASKRQRGEVTPPAEAFLGGAGQAVLSPDGQTVAAARGSQVWLYDAGTLQPIRTLGGSHRVATGILFSAGFIAWSVLWGVIARRRRRREELHGQARPPAYRLPKPYENVIHPRRTLIGCLGWLLVLLALAIVPSLWTGQAIWDRLIGVGFVAGVVFSISLLVAVFRHWLRRRGGPDLARARRIAGQALRRQQVQDGVTAHFFTDSPLSATIQDDFRAARRRFCELVGEPVELRRPLSILVFADSDQLDAYIDGRLGMAGLYWSVGAPQILLAEQTAREQLLESRTLFRRLLANYFVEEYHRVPLSAGLVSLVGWMLASPASPAELRRIHRRLRAGSSEAGASATDNPLTISAAEFAQLAVGRDQPQNYQRLQWLSCQFASLAEYLGGAQAGGRRERFGRFLRDAGSSEPLEDVFSRHFAHGISQLLQDWRTWAARQQVEPYDLVPPEFERHVIDKLLPGIRDETMPVRDRVRLVRCLGGGGYVTGADELIRLLASGVPGELRIEVVWALESISGKRFGGDVDKWRLWWDQASPYAVMAEVVPPHEGAPPTRDGDADANVAQSPRDATPYDTATCTRTTDTATRPQPASSAVAPKPDAPPRRLKICWNLLAVSGAVAIIWSVLGSFVLPYHPAGLINYLGVVSGVYALTRGVGHAARGLRLAVGGQELCFLTCNPISPLLALAAASHLRDPLVKHHLEARQ